jgi:hypothetical protein
MGMQFSEQEVDEMIHEVDVDGDGEINYEEFVKVGVGGSGAFLCFTRSADMHIPLQMMSER